MELGGAHVAAAAAALTVGTVVLVRRKGDATHVAFGRVYLAAMVGVNAPVLFLYEATGRPGPFHLLAAVSVLTTAMGWVSLRGTRGRRRVEAHAALMTWSWVGVVTAGLAQAANRQWPERSPWPVLAVVVSATAVALVVVPRYVAHALDRRLRGGAGQLRSDAAPARAGCS
jgi:uncharacterized membrane protein